MTISASQVMSLRSATGAGMMDCKKALEESGGDMDKARDFLRKKGIAVAAKKSDRATREGGVAIALNDDASAAGMVRLACETDFVARNEKFKGLLERMARQVLAKGDADVPAQTLADGGGTVTEALTAAISTTGENIQFIEARRVALNGQGLVSGYVHSTGKIGVLVVLQCGAAKRGELERVGRDVAMHIAASNVVAIDQSGIPQAELDKEQEIFMAQARESGKPDDIAQKMVQGRLKKFVKEISLLDQPFVKDPDKTVQAMLAEAGKALGAGIAVKEFVKFKF
ncbi:MAG: elongation factor Ts [Candidatus Lambdaproteobacteria bacterium]|nr:elongation factor Ts [Candidatus Lambdaproteobacteria bacterium]